MKKNSIFKYCIAFVLGLSASLSASYQVETVAGLAGAYAHTDGVGTAARFKHPGMMSIDNSSNLLIADDDKAVRKVTTTGGIYNASTLFYANNVFGGEPLDAICQYIVNGTTTYLTTHQYIDLMQWTQSGGTYVSNTSFDQGGGGYSSGNDAWGLVIDSSNNIFMTSSAENKIYKIFPNGSYSSFVQNAALNGLTGITIDSSSNLYVSATGSNTICKITPAGVVTTIAGTAGSVGSSNGVGSAARFNSPWDIDIDAAGNLYVADRGNNLIRKLTNNSGVYTVSTIAGLAGSSGSSDGVGSAARFNAPTGLAVDASGNIFVSDTNNNTIRRLFLLVPVLEINFTTGAAVIAAIAGGANFNGSGDVTFSGSASDNVTLTSGNVKMGSAAPIASGKKIIAAGGSIEATAGFSIPQLDVTSHALTVRATGGSAADIAGLTGSSAVALTGSTGFALSHDLSASGSALSAASSVPMSLGANAKLPTGNHQIAGTLVVAQNPASGSHYSSASMIVHELDVSASGLVAAAFGNVLTVTKVKLGAMTFAQNITAGTL